MVSACPGRLAGALQIMQQPNPACLSLRDDLMKRWVASCQAKGIPVSHDCTLRGTLATPVEVCQGFGPHEALKSA